MSASSWSDRVGVEPSAAAPTSATPRTPAALAESWSHGAWLDGKAIGAMSRRSQSTAAADQARPNPGWGTREGRNTWMSIQPAGLRLIPAIHEAWHDLYRSYGDELGETQAEAVNQQIVKLIKGGNP